MFRTIVPSVVSLIFAAGLGAQTRPADTLDASRRCVVNRTPEESLGLYVKRCAEDFVTRNGYTSAPATNDSSQWATESIEIGSSWKEVLQWRHNTLRAQAVSAGCDSTGCAALFLSTDPKERCYWRVVTMNARGMGMRMQHQSAVPRSGSAEERECRKG
jgi:hypothetical protein